MKFKLTADAFIEPVLYKQGTVVTFPPDIGIEAIGMAYEPADDEAQELWNKWAKANPAKAVGAKPFEELDVAPKRAMPVAVEAPVPEEVEIEQTTGMAMAKQTKAKPDLAQGGKAVKVA